ncbi:MAG: DNA polymerase III subunit gamma/tau [Acidimicrobiales bacterium]
MAYQSLYRRYRSQTFGEVLGQPHVTNALRSAVAENRQSHAYLFSGPRGTGKTSTARVLAKALNCENLAEGEPCGTCASCQAIESGRSFDLHELDAASHNKVDDVRDLISKVQLGSPGRTKVYILDEVHMLSSGAENALLKTLEEPPDHVVFVLATTEPQKVVPTIRSRTQHFEFHLLPAEVLAEHVRWVIADAGLDVDDDAIDYVLRQGGGSARDTLSALDLVAAAGGVPEGNDVAELLVRAIGQRDPGRAIAAVQEGLELGREPRTIGEDTIELLRNAFLGSMGAPLHHLNDRAAAVAGELAAELGPATLTRALEVLGRALVEMRQAPDPRVPLEVTLLELTRRAPAGAGGDVAGLLDRITELEERMTQLEAGAPRSSRPAGRALPTRSDDGRPTSPDGAPSPDGRPSRDDPAPDPTPTPDPSASGRGRAPSQPPREREADSASRSPRPPQRRGQSPIGSTTDGQAEHRDHGAAAPAPAAAAAHVAPPTPPETAADAASPATDGPGAGQSPASTAAAAATPAPSPPGSDATTLTVDGVRGAFSDLLGDLSQRVRARFKGGQIIGVEGDTVRFGAPHPIHRDRCDEVKGDVEQALSARFGRPVSIVVVIDDQAAPSQPEPGRLAESSRPPGDEDDDIGPISELVDATETSSKGVDRLTQAFPGSEVISSTPDDAVR